VRPVSQRLTARRAAQPREEEGGIRGGAGESETHRTAGGTAAGRREKGFGVRPVSQRLTARRAAQPRGRRGRDSG